MDPAYSDRALKAVQTAVTDNKDAQEVLQAAYHAISQGNFDALGKLVTDDVELSICGFGPMIGSWRGRAKVIEAIKRNFTLVDGQQPEIECIVSQGDRIGVLLRENGVLKSTGQAYRAVCVQWFTLADGKINMIDEIITLFDRC